MKKSIYGLLMLSVVTLASCEKLLEEKPAYTVNNITVFESESSAKMALMGCYAYLTNYSAYGQNYLELVNGPTGLVFGQNNNVGYAEFAALNVSETNVTSDLSWNGLYKVISECNYFISGVEKGTLSQEYKDQATAEAKFLRALCYFNLANAYGGVPLRVDPATSTTVDLPRSSREDVYAQVEQDWKFAAENLAAQNESGRASKYAAYAYLAKLYWMLGSHENTASSPYWSKAKEMGDIVIQSSAFALESKFSALFKPASLGSVESIFQINFSSSTNGYGNRGNWVFSPTNSSNPGISWARYRASKAFFDLFKGTYPDDPRLAETFSTMYKQIKSNNHVLYTYPYLFDQSSVNTAVTDSIDYTLLADPTNPKVEELSEPMVTAFVKSGNRDFGWPYFKKQYDAAATAQNSNKNHLVYRYADFLLLMADVENELGNAQKSADFLNQVLTRARNSAGVASQFPANVSSLSQTAMRERVFYERLFELAGEFDMFTDVRRRGTEFFTKVLERNDNHHITRAHVAFNKANANNQPYMDYLILDGVSDKADFVKRNMLLPIPRNELNTNGGLELADQNYGY